MAGYCEDCKAFWDIQHPIQECILYRYLHLLNLDVFFSVQNHYACILFASQYMIYDDSVSLLFSFKCLMFAVAFRCIVWHISSVIPFSTFNEISISVNNCNFTIVFFKNACHNNPGADKKWAGSSSYIPISLLRTFSNTFASNNVLL